MLPETLHELRHYMMSNCYNDNYAIGTPAIGEGFGLDVNDNGFTWYYTERGKRENLKIFKTEKEAVEYTYTQLKSDSYARRHLIGFVKGSLLKEQLTTALKSRGIEFFVDEILYRANDIRYRFFVFGCAVNEVSDLKERFGI